MLKKFLPLLAALKPLLGAVQPETDVSLSAGWREDEIRSFVVEAATIAPAPFGPFASETLQVRDIRLSEIGAQGQLAIPSCWTTCDTWWVSQLYLKGYAYWGHVYNGKYSAIDRKIPETDPTTRTGDLGDVHSGQSRNFNIAVGFIYPSCEDWGIGISGGYQYDRLDVKVRNMVKVQKCSFTSSSDTCTATTLDTIQEGLKYRTKWKGPWIGVNLVYVYDDYGFTIGYEYHRTHWNALFQLPGPDQTGTTCSGFSMKSKGRSSYGNVLFLEAGTQFCNAWELILGVKYSVFRGSGRRAPLNNNTFAGLGCHADEIDHVRKGRWDSFQATLDVGYQF